MRTSIAVLTLASLTLCLASRAQETTAKKVEWGKNIFLEIDKAKDTRRVWVQAAVCLKQGQLEQLLTRKRTKEHEAVLTADIDASVLHSALEIARAEAGSPVKYQPKFEAPKGTTIKVTLQWEENGKTKQIDAKQWLRSSKTKKTLDRDWVFTGSVLYKDPIDSTKKPYYAANDGDVICIANFEAAMMDVPFESTKENDELNFEANTEIIPAVETKVWVILEAVKPAKK